jgi:hypothetical protein
MEDLEVADAPGAVGEYPKAFRDLPSRRRHR